MMHSAKVTLCAGIRTKPCGRNERKATTGNDVASFITGGLLHVVTSTLASVKYYVTKSVRIPLHPLSISNFNILFKLRVLLMCQVFERGECSAFSEEISKFECWGGGGG